MQPSSYRMNNDFASSDKELHQLPHLHLRLDQHCHNRKIDKWVKDWENLFESLPTHKQLLAFPNSEKKTFRKHKNLLSWEIKNLVEKIKNYQNILLVHLFYSIFQMTVKTVKYFWGPSKEHLHIYRRSWYNLKT